MSPFRVLLSLMSPNKEYANGDKYDGWWYNGSSAGGLLVFKHEGTRCYHILADVEGVPNLFVLIIASCFQLYWWRGQCSGLGIYFFADGSQYQGAWNHGKYESWTQPSSA